MSLACKYHQEQGEAIGFALGMKRYSMEEANAERRELAKEIAACEECMTIIGAPDGAGR